MQSKPFEVCGSKLSKAVKSLSALSSAIPLTNQTDRPSDQPPPSLPSLCLRARSPRLKSTRFHVDGEGRREGGPLRRSAGARDTRMPGATADGRTAYRQLRQDKLKVE